MYSSCPLHQLWSLLMYISISIPAALRVLAGEVLTGWRVYPLQLDDLGAIDYSNSSSRLVPPATAIRIAASSGSDHKASALANAGAASVGPVFYRCSCCARTLHPALLVCHLFCFVTQVKSISLAAYAAVRDCQQHCSLSVKAPRLGHSMTCCGPHTKLRDGEEFNSGVCLCRGTFTIDESLVGSGLEGHLPDTFASVRGWGKGLAWINGFNLGWCAPYLLQSQFAMP